MKSAIMMPEIAANKVFLCHKNAEFPNAFMQEANHPAEETAIACNYKILVITGDCVTMIFQEGIGDMAIRG